MTITDRVRRWRFYHRYPHFQGPYHPHWVGTQNVEFAWRYAEELKFPEALGRETIVQGPWDKDGIKRSKGAGK